MAYESLFFVALTAGYFISLFFHERIVNWEPFRFGIYTYYVLIVLIAGATIARSMALDEYEPTAIMQVDIWFGGLTWLAAGSSTVFLLASLMPTLPIKRARSVSLQPKASPAQREASLEALDAADESDASSLIDDLTDQ